MLGHVHGPGHGPSSLGRVCIGLGNLREEKIATPGPNPGTLLIGIMKWPALASVWGAQRPGFLLFCSSLVQSTSSTKVRR